MRKKKKNIMISKKDGFDLHIRWDFPDAKKYAFTFIILFISLIIIYGNSFFCEFHFDDFPNIINNPNLHLKSLSWENIKKTFYGANDVGTKIIRPLSYFTLGLNYYFGEKNVVGYHIVNFIIHYIASIFLFLFIYNTLKLPLLKSRYETTAYPIALLSTFLWATHPLQVTSVTYIVQRMASMAGMFYIMAIYFYLKGRSQKSIKYFVLCGIAAVLSFASKENAAMLPVSLFLFDLFLIQGVTRENLKYHFKILIIPVMILLGLGLFYIQVDIASIIEAYNDRPFTPLERVLTQPRIILFYLSLLFYPIDSRLTFLYDIDISKSLFMPITTLPAILIIFAIIGVALWICQKRALIAFCILFFFVNHLIESSILPLELIYEHRNYIPSMLLFILPSILMLMIIDYFSYIKCIQFLFIFVFTFLISAQAHTVYSRNYIFKDEITIWKDNIKKSPNLSRPYNNLGTEYWKIGLYDKAYEEMQKALELKNVSNTKITATYHENIGMYYLKKKDYDKAKQHLMTSKEIYNGYPDPRTLYGLAMVYYKQGDSAESQKYIEKAILNKPDEIDYHLILSLILLKSGDIDQAVNGANYMLRVETDYALPLMILAESMKIKGRYEMAILYWERFLKKYPRYIRGYLALIELFSITGKDKKINTLLAQVIYLKGDKSYLEIMHEGDDDIIVYEPKSRILLPIIRKNLAEQSNEIKNLDK